MSRVWKDASVTSGHGYCSNSSQLVMGPFASSIQAR